MTEKAQVAIVTGAAGYLGEIVANGLLSAGTDVRGWDITQPDRTLNFPLTVCDVANPDSVDQAINELKQSVSEVNVLVNVAGLICNAPLLNLLDRKDPRHSVELWQRCITSNLTTTFMTTRAVAAWMVSRRTRGVIVNFSSVAARGNAGQSAYSAAKAGIEAMTVTWAKELGALGIRVVAIAPGFIDTPSTRAALSADRLADLERQIPLRKLGQPQAILQAVQHAITNEYLTGAVIPVDGGFRL